ncbi:hypothetical protein [Streptomyces sp. NPDC018059]|uniref:hypothetical protein n=1 Tax=Streptomyces sp. NPDC018059 TaxID=3365041 RepID=UPI0037A0CFB7
MYASAVVVPVLLLGMVACGADSGGGDEGAKVVKASGGSQRGEGRGEDAAAVLKAMELSGEDIGPRREIRVLDNGLAAGYGKSDSAADPARCRPLDLMSSYSSRPKPKAFHPYAVVEKGTTYDKPKGEELVVGLAAHDEAGAKKVMAGLRDAVAKCGKGFESAEGTYGEVRDWPAQGIGDEAVAYVLQGGTHGEFAAARFTVVRSGSTVITFRATDLEAPSELTGPDLKLVDAQVEKAEKAEKEKAE